ncbi:MAG: carboxypeptidase-like regulatory domain-containing protein [Vicinamibacterales bacterium]
MKYIRCVPGVFVALAALMAIACHPGPVVSAGPDQPSVGGTIAGIVSTETKAAVANRKVTAIDVKTGAKFEATTGPNGGYTIKVAQGTYRLEVELHPGETVVKHPGETRINRSDLDPQRHFVLSGVKTGG